LGHFRPLTDKSGFVRVNGHEWAKRQLDKRGIGYEALDNGFLSCAEPEKLQQICDSLGPEQIERLFRKWLKRIPLPLRFQTAHRSLSASVCRIATSAGFQHCSSTESITGAGSLSPGR
jgi:hypothetical protein